MSEATGRCGCGWYTWAADGDLCWRHWGEDGTWEDAAIGTFCWQCGHQLLAEGRTLPPATEGERRNAKRLEELDFALEIEESVSLAKKAGGDVCLRPFDGAVIFSRTLADAIDAYIAAHPQEEQP